MFLTDASLPVPHGFFGRNGGVGTGLYESLNCGWGTPDDRVAAIQNRSRVASALGGDPQKLVTLYQDHTALCVKVTQTWKPGEGPKADAMVTDIPGILLGILTADCAPVLFYGKRSDGNGVIGAAHAGWKGALGGVLENTIKMMEQERARNIAAVIGPCIGPQSYEVSAGFEKPFLAQDAANKLFFRDNHFDLPGYAARRLKLAGAHVALAAPDTYTNEADYFSYRRATHRKDADYGRQIAVITL